MRPRVPPAPARASPPWKPPGGGRAPPPRAPFTRPAAGEVAVDEAARGGHSAWLCGEVVVEDSVGGCRGRSRRSSQLARKEIFVADPPAETGIGRELRAGLGNRRGEGGDDRSENDRL